MSRPERVETVELGGRVAVVRSTATLLSIAVATIIVSTLVVRNTSDALEPEAIRATSAFEAGTVDLSDDDEGRSLFDLGNMAPGRPRAQCIEVVYRGSITPATVSLAAAVEGELAPFLDVRVSRGTGGSFDDCDGFVELGAVWQGTVADLAAETASRPLEVVRVTSSPSRITFRVEVEVRDDAGAMGRSATVDLVWESAAG